MGIASIVHLYVFPAKPYSLMGERLTGTVSVLGDYASVDCPLDPDEVRDSERPTKLRLPQPGPDIKSRTAIRESVRDVVFGGGVYVRIPTTIFFFFEWSLPSFFNTDILQSNKSRVSNPSMHMIFTSLEHCHK